MWCGIIAEIMLILVGKILGGGGGEHLMTI